MKMSHGEGLGTLVMQADEFTEKQEQTLLECLAPTKAPKHLLYYVFSILAKCFSVRGGVDSRNLLKSQFSFQYDSAQDRWYVEMAEGKDKTHSGGLKQVKRPAVKPRRVYSVVPGENVTDLKCLVFALKFYLSKCPPSCTFFYHTPLSNPTEDYWFSRVPYGKNMLSSITKKWLALIPESDKIIFNGYKHTNHSWKVTTAVRLFSAGARTDQVKAVTGHYSDRAVQTYNRIRPLQQLATSGVIQKNLLSKKNENKKNGSASSVFPAISCSGDQLTSSETVDISIKGGTPTAQSVSRHLADITSRMQNTNCVLNFHFQSK